MAYILRPLSTTHMPVLYEWAANEPNRDLHTCRPISELPSKDDFVENLKKKVEQGIQQVYLIMAGDEIDNPLGKVTLFDFNPRNHSAEFGYYIPAKLRGKGVGRIMIGLLLERVFSQGNELNKLYATTASNNEASIRVLERIGFTLDGRLREHYWIGEKRYEQLHYSMLRSDWEQNRIVPK